jgi:hypothetical protein
MGLAERRAATDFQTNAYPALKKQIDDAAGFDVPLEIDWQAIAQPNYQHLYNEFWTKIYFEPLIGAFQRICADEIGKEAMKGGLKKVEITNSRQYFDRDAFFLQNGVLKIDHELVNADHLKLRTDKLVSLLEAAL